jgi:hypothetical protein
MPSPWRNGSMSEIPGQSRHALPVRSQQKPATSDILRRRKTTKPFNEPSYGTSLSGVSAGGRTTDQVLGHLAWNLIVEVRQRPLFCGMIFFPVLQRA